MGSTTSDALSSSSTIHHQPTGIHPTLNAIHADPTATVVAPALTDSKLEQGSQPTSSVTRTVFRSTRPAVQGFWRKRLCVSPGFKGDPREELSRVQKAVILCVISQAGSLGGFSSTIYFPSLVQIKDDLHASRTAIDSSVSLFILFMGISPLITSTISDRFKIRRILYLVYILIFAAASFGGGYAKSAVPLILARVFQAIGSGGASILGAGTVADIYAPEEQGTAMGLMFLGQFLGPVLGPPVGGLLAEAFHWPSTFFFMAILSAIVIVELFFFLPETYRQEVTVLSNADEKDAEQEMTPVKKKFNPFQSVLLLRHPVIFLASLETGMVFALMFSIETIAPQLFAGFYNLTESQTGFTYIAAGVGSVVGAVIGGRLSDLSLLRAKAKNGGELVLEDRLSLNMWFAGFAIVPLGSLLFGWGAEKHLHIAAPIAGFGIYNFGMAQVMSAGAAYLVNAIPGQGSSATAAANFLKMVFACVTSLIAQIIVDNVGYGNYGLIQAAINIFCMALFYIVKLRGAGMRAAAVRKEQ